MTEFKYNKKRLDRNWSSLFMWYAVMRSCAVVSFQFVSLRLGNDRRSRIV